MKALAAPCVATEVDARAHRGARRRLARARSTAPPRRGAEVRASIATPKPRPAAKARGSSPRPSSLETSAAARVARAGCRLVDGRGGFTHATGTCRWSHVGDLSPARRARGGAIRRRLAARAWALRRRRSPPVAGAPSGGARTASGQQAHARRRSATSKRRCAARAGIAPTGDVARARRPSRRRTSSQRDGPRKSTFCTIKGELQPDAHRVAPRPRARAPWEGDEARLGARTTCRLPARGGARLRGRRGDARRAPEVRRRATRAPTA